MISCFFSYTETRGGIFLLYFKLFYQEKDLHVSYKKSTERIGNLYYTVPWHQPGLSKLHPVAKDYLLIQILQPFNWYFTSNIYKTHLPCMLADMRGQCDADGSSPIVLDMTQLFV